MKKNQNRAGNGAQPLDSIPVPTKSKGQCHSTENLHTAISDTVKNTEETKSKILLGNKIYKYSPIHQILRMKLLVLYPNLCNSKKRVVFKLHLASVSSENENCNVFNMSKLRY